MRKEELDDFLLSDIYKEIKNRLNIFKEESKEELINLDFDRDYAPIKAVKLQGNMDAVNKLFDIIQDLKDEFEIEKSGGEEEE
ncbi:MAG: hypothetical protein A2309_02985 [Bacteroidetes bacterium RIFOXYB2_FULL_35_7]|nr:MAG: hypothetical protein A2309_02985 [Bacteroidetes bacterium RIFOXYB2_FULL_35_7]